jgi:hypothetical protein
LVGDRHATTVAAEALAADAVTPLIHLGAFSVSIAAPRLDRTAAR